MRACIRRDPSLGAGTHLELESQGETITIAVNEAGSPGGIHVSGVERFTRREPWTIGSFTITPYLTDECDGVAHAVRVEADGVAVLYAGDLQAGAVQKLLACAPPRVDVLFMDGAAVSFAVNEGFPTELDFEEKFAHLFRQTDGLPLVWCSRQNIDRIHTIHRACLRTNRQFIVDPATAETLRLPQNERVAHAMAERIRVFVSSRRMRKLALKNAVPLAAIPDGIRIYPEQLAAAAPTSVVLFRPSLMTDLEAAGCLRGARLIFSMWLGYLEYEKANPVLEWLEKHGIPLDRCHASRHAAVIELIRLRETFATAAVTPIRSPQVGRFDELFGGVQRRADGEWFEILPTRSAAV
jgi:ribonuclease J